VRQGDPTLPETIPAPFLEIARQCLRLDPERRWTVPDIAARLLPTATPPKKASPAGYVLASILVLALAGFVIVPKLLHRNPPATAADMPTQNKPMDAQANPEPAIEKHEAPRLEMPRPTEVPHEKTPSPAAPEHASGSAKREAPTRGAVNEQVLPKVSQRSLNTITGKVRVTVRVAADPAGKVSNASLQSPGPSEYFAKVALEASRHWKFDAPEAKGDGAPSTWLLHYAFSRRGVEVHPEQVSH